MSPEKNKKKGRAQVDAEILRIRKLVRWEMTSVIKGMEHDYAELKYVLQPNQLKAEVRKIMEDSINYKVSEVVQTHLEKMIRRLTEAHVEAHTKEAIIQKINSVAVVDVAKERITKMINEDLHGFILSAVETAVKEVSGRINRQLRKVVNLKTSTVMEIKASLEEPLNEEEALRALYKEFPEYYQAIGIESSKEDKVERLLIDRSSGVQEYEE